eukprot:ANDGO_00948.mRNA.1 hypothetical protein
MSSIPQTPLTPGSPPPRSASSAYAVGQLLADCERRLSRLHHPLPLSFIESVFNAICDQISQNYAALKGTSIAGFGKFTLRVDRRDLGTLGVQETHVPMFVPADIFLRANDIRTSQKSANRQLVSTVEVNVSIIVQNMQARKEWVQNVIKHLVDQLGVAIGTGFAVDVSFGFGRLLSDKKILHFHFSKNHKSSNVQVMKIEHSSTASPAAPPAVAQNGHVVGSLTEIEQETRALSSSHGTLSAPTSKFRPVSPNRLNTPSIVSPMPFSATADRPLSASAMSPSVLFGLESATLSPKTVPARLGYRDATSHSNSMLVEGAFDGGNIANQRPLKKPEVSYIDELAADDPRREIIEKNEQLRRSAVRYAKYKGTRDSLFDVQHAAENLVQSHRADIDSPHASLDATLGAMPTSPESYKFLTASPDVAFNAINMPPGARLQNAMADAADRYRRDLEVRRSAEDARQLEFDAQVVNAKKLEQIHREEHRMEMAEMRRMLQKQMEEAKSRKERETDFVRAPVDAPFPRPESYLTREQDHRNKAAFRDRLDEQMSERELLKRQEMEAERKFQAEATERARRELLAEREEVRRKKELTTQTLTDAWSKQRDFSKREAFVMRHSSPSKDLQKKLSP